MKTAIDCYARGKQKEANADDYPRGAHYFTGRFICPECGELVHLTGSKYSNHFAHYKKSETSAECDRRVDGVPTQSIYEKLGLPIYLRKDSNNNFRLFLGFRSLQSSTLEQATKDNMSFSISGSTAKYIISPERFKPGETTLIPISFVPRNQDKYHIVYEPTNCAKKISQYWSDEADGFSYEGALFLASELGGKKVRHGDNVFTETDYYWVRKHNDLPSFAPGINMKKNGVLMLNDCKYNVFYGYFTSAITDSAFSRLTRYLRESLKVNLLEKEPKYIPLWPPCIKTEDGYVVNANTRECFGHIQSGNDIPKMYVYRGAHAIPQCLNAENNMVRIPLTSELTYINIDRKYVSGGTTIVKGSKDYPGVEMSVICNLDNLEQQERNLTINSEIRNLKLEFPFGMDIIVLYTNGGLSYQRQQKNLELYLENVQKVLIYSNLFVWLSISVLSEREEYQPIEETTIIKLVELFRNTETVVMPAWCRDKLVKYYPNSPQVNKLLLSNEIPIPLIIVLGEENHE